jgi:hypothetical protein
VKRLIALALTALLSGCAQIPTGLDVRSGPEIVAQAEQEFSYYSPSTPVPGASAQEIVSGFLAAGTGPQNDYAIARQFLSREFAQRWKPDNQVLIRSGVPQFRETRPNLQLVSLQLAAKLDANGRYQEAGPGEVATLRFQLMQEDGEWRISGAPNLTVVTPPVFSVVFRPYSAFFLDSLSRRLVADQRWFPSRASTATRLVNALLAGPADWLALSTRNAIPSGTKLTVDAVTVQDGVALVDFDSAALAADSQDRSLMLSQLRATLLQLPGVNNVSVSVNSSPQEISPAALMPLKTGQDGYFLSNGVFRLGAEAQAVAGTQSLVENLQPSQFAINGAGSRVAFVTPSGLYLLESAGVSTKTTKLSELSAIAAIEFDPEGYLWAYPSISRTDVLVFDSEGLVKAVEFPVAGRRVTAALSPEGSRLAVVFERENGNQLQLFSITRDSRLRPEELASGVALSAALGDPVSITWQNQTTLRVLELSGLGTTVLSDYPVFGPRTALPTPPVRGKKIVAGSNQFSSYLLDDNGDVWTLVGGNWRKVRGSTTDIAPQH